MTTSATNGVDNSPLTSYIQQQQQAAAAASANSNSSSSTSLQGLSGNFNTFLQILTTQLTHQDPTAATDTNQFTQELVEFSQVEQQLNTNSNLQTLINLQKGSVGLSSSIGFMNQYVETPSANGQFPLQNSQAEIAYTLPSAAKTVSINVTDSTGKTVATLTGPTTAGLDRVAWDGKDSSGTQLSDGAYTFNISALDASGNAITVTDQRTVGVVTGLQSNSDGTISLSLGPNMTVSSSSVDAVWASGSPPQATLGDPSSSSSSNNSNSSNNNTTS